MNVFEVIATHPVYYIPIIFLLSGVLSVIILSKVFNNFFTPRTVYNKKIVDKVKSKQQITTRKVEDAFINDNFDDGEKSQGVIIEYEHSQENETFVHADVKRTSVASGQRQVRRGTMCGVHERGAGPIVPPPF